MNSNVLQMTHNITYTPATFSQVYIGGCVPKTVLNAIRKTAFSYVFIQAAVILLIASLFSIFGKGNAGLSILLGGMICITPNLYFAHKLFYRTGAQAAYQIIRSFYWGELIKILLTVLLFYLVFKFLVINKILLFVGYILAQITFWFASLYKYK
jgi:ATP synthase protein I